MSKIRIFNPARAGLLLFFCCFYGYAQTPDWTWARGASGGSDEGISVATDKSDNVYITGLYAPTIIFGSTTLTSTALYSAYLAKYDSQGNVKWALSAVGPAGFHYSESYSVCTDTFGNVYITGDYSSKVTFGPYTFTTGTGNSGFFIVKYDSSGNVLWARTTGGILDNSQGSAVASDLSGNVYVTGYFSSSTLTFGSHTISNAGNTDLFLVKYDSSGTAQWARSAGGNSADEGHAVATDASANVYITGFFSSTANFGSYSLATTGGQDIFVAGYDSSGNVLWAKGAGGSANDGTEAVATDASGNIYLTGYYSSPSIAFGSFTLANGGGKDAFLTKYDSAGNVGWAKNISGKGNETGWSVCTDKKNKIYLTCNFDSTSVTFDTITVQRPAIHLDPIFIAGFDSAGHGLFAKPLGSGGDDWSSVTVGPSGCIYICGDFYQINPFILGNDSLILTGQENTFVAKLCYSAQALPVSNFSASQKVFCEAGGCINFFDSSSGNPTSWKWLFPGASPNFSNVQNPISICYNNTGTYPVTLIVTNSAGTDTLTISPMIVVSAGAIPPVVTISKDTNFSSHGATYQWYRDGIIIAGAIDSFYVCSQGGTYSVRTTDSLGCSALSNGVYNSCLTGINEWTMDNGQLTIYPNPASEALVISYPGYSGFGKEATLEIYNVFGEQVYSAPIESGSNSKKINVNCNQWAAGVYIIKIMYENTEGLGSNMKIIIK